jgi:hypothetical protein
MNAAAREVQGLRSLMRAGAPGNDFISLMAGTLTLSLLYATNKCKTLK